MSSLINLSIKGKDGSYKNYTVSVSDETNDYGQNVVMYVSQTKEQREAKEKKQYVANGSVVWTDGKITTAFRKEQVSVAVSDFIEDLPF